MFAAIFLAVFAQTFAQKWMIAVCNAVFGLTIISCCFLEIFSIKSQSCQKSRRTIMLLGRQILGEYLTPGIPY